MKKILAILLSVSIAAITLSGCSAEELKAVDQTNNTLNIFANVGTSFRFEAALKLYKEQYPDVEVQMQKQAITDQETSIAEHTKLSSELMAGKGPDLFSITSAYWDVEKLVSQGIFADMEPFFKADNFDWEPYQQVVMQGGVWDGKRYVVPLMYGIPVLYTTQKAIDETGFNIENCKDFYGFMHETQKIMDDPNQTRTIFRQSWTMKWFPQIANIDFVGTDNKMDLSTPGLREGTQWCRDHFAEDMEDYNLFDGVGAAAVRDGLSLFEYSISFNLAMGLLFDYGLMNTFDKGVMLPIRNLEGGLEARVYDTVGVRANSPNLQNAYNFIKILLSPELNTICVKNQSEISVLNDTNWEVYESRKMATNYMNEINGFSENDEIPKSAMEQFMGYTKEIDHAYFSDWAQSEFMSAMSPYFYEDAPLDETLKQAKRKVDLYLSE